MSDNSSPEENMSYTDVLIVGAGPSGLMAGQALARLGIKFRIIDRRLPGTLYGSADGFQARTMEVWKSYDMTDKLFKTARFIKALVMYRQTENGIQREQPSINVLVKTRYPFEAAVGVEYIEGILQEVMEQHGGILEQPAVPIRLNISGDQRTEYPVQVAVLHLEDEDATRLINGEVNKFDLETGIKGRKEVINAKYLIGADGAHSWVRHSLEIPMEGDQTDYIWGVMDLEMTTDFPDPLFKCILQSEKSSVIFIPREEKLTRIYVRLNPADVIRTEDGRIDKAKISLELSRQLLTERIDSSFYPYKINIKQIVWSTIFIVAQRVAAQYAYKNRVFIVGDACHTHSPTAGQGANASMNDSHNLAWKLAYVLKGYAKASLLETYDQERRRVAMDIIAFDKELTYMLSKDQAADYNKLWYKQNLYVTGIGVQYRSLLSRDVNQSLASNLVIGQRLPPGPLLRLGDWSTLDLQDLALSDGLFKIILFAGDIKVSENKSRLQEFSDALEEVLKQSRISPLLQLPVTTIARGQKEKIHWKEVPAPLQYLHKVYIDDTISIDPTCGKLYEDLMISPSGVAVLVRPDGYISMINPVTNEGAKGFCRFIADL